MVVVHTKRTPSRKRVGRQTKGLSAVSIQIQNLLVVVVVGSIVCAYFVIQRHEERVREQYPKTVSRSASQILSKGKPFLVYGTAWKEERTADLVAEAIRQGFRFIDTANQPKHYNEAGVGDGWTRAANELHLDRSDLFLQTKYSPNQDKDPPYDPQASLPDQVITSVQSSLKHLRTNYIDSLVLHSPLRTMQDTLTVWKAMEQFVEDGTVKHLGISNCYDLETFQTLYESARIKPIVLQNRFYEKSNFDTELRKFVKRNNVSYQSFWTLTANRQALSKSSEIMEMANAKGLTPQTLMFAFLMSLGYITPLSGTTNIKHMQQDVDIMERIQAGEIFFETEQELRVMAKAIGMPDL